MKRMGRSPTTHSQNTSPENDEEESRQYKCPKCKDLEMYRVVTPEFTGMKYCECRKIREAERALRNSGLEGVIKEKRFDNFYPKEEWQKDLLDRAIRYGKEYFKAKEEGRTLPWLYVGGQSGSGKSHICTAICGVMMKKGVPIRYMEWTSDSRKLRALANTPDYDGLLDKLIDVELLYIDDLFKQKSRKYVDASNAEVKTLFEILNKRLMRNKATIISSEWYLKTELMNMVDGGTMGRIHERTGYGEFVVSIPRDEKNDYRVAGGR